jgi:phosphatidylinositol glycan class S
MHAQATTASEEAFFHPTMLSMLYFPDDHKMAVYIPYFVPVLLPVSLLMTCTWLMHISS